MFKGCLPINICLIDRCLLADVLSHWCPLTLESNFLLWQTNILFDFLSFTFQLLSISNQEKICVAAYTSHYFLFSLFAHLIKILSFDLQLFRYVPLKNSSELPPPTQNYYQVIIFSPLISCQYVFPSYIFLQNFISTFTQWKTGYSSHSM